MELTLVLGSLQFNLEVTVSRKNGYGHVEQYRIPCNYPVGSIRDVVHNDARFDSWILDCRGFLERRSQNLVQRDPQLQPVDLQTKHNHFFGVDLHNLIVCHGNRDRECDLVPVLAHVPCGCVEIEL